MPVKTRKKKRKKVRYRIIKLKLTAGQYNSLLGYCNARKTTPNKLIKKLLKPRLQYVNGVPEDFYVTENQLELFESGHS
ncbi:MAG: hypothetical protein R6W71_01210 [Bacteroidales bacterium]|jgi:hypothetical protein